MGRPKLEEPLEVLAVRLPADLISEIDGLAALKDMKRGDLIREALADGVSRANWAHTTSAVLAALRDLQSRANHSGGVPIRALGKAVPWCSDFSDVLLRLEKRGRVRLVAVAGAGSGVSVAGRGELNAVKLLPRPKKPER